MTIEPEEQEDGTAFWPMAIGGAVLSAIPFLGGFMLLGLGMAAMTMGKAQRRKGQRFLPDEDMTPLSQATVGDLDVVATGTVNALSDERLSGRWTTANAVVLSAEVRRVTGNVGDYQKMWSNTSWLAFEVADGEALGLISSRDADVMSSTSRTEEWSGMTPTEIEEHIGGTHLEPSRMVDGSLEDYQYEYVEWGIVPGETVRVVGTMTGTDETERERTSYRDAGFDKRTLVHARQVSNVVGESLDRVIKGAKVLQAMGVLYLVLSVATSIAWAAKFSLF